MEPSASLMRFQAIELEFAESALGTFRRASSFAGRRFAGDLQHARPATWISISSPSFSFNGLHHAAESRTARLLPHFATAYAGGSPLVGWIYIFCEYIFDPRQHNFVIDIKRSFSKLASANGTPSR